MIQPRQQGGHPARARPAEVARSPAKGPRRPELEAIPDRVGSGSTSARAAAVAAAVAAAEHSLEDP